jgi:hypothetical protein
MGDERPRARGRGAGSEAFRGEARCGDGAALRRERRLCVERRHVLLERGHLSRRGGPATRRSSRRLSASFPPGISARFSRRGFPRCRRFPSTTRSWKRRGAVETLLAQFDWDDVGLWTALPKHLHTDAAGNASRGRRVCRRGEQQHCRQQRAHDRALRRQGPRDRRDGGRDPRVSPRLPCRTSRKSYSSCRRNCCRLKVSAVGARPS